MGEGKLQINLKLRFRETEMQAVSHIKLYQIGQNMKALQNVLKVVYIECKCTQRSERRDRCVNEAAKSEMELKRKPEGTDGGNVEIIGMQRGKSWKFEAG